MNELNFEILIWIFYFYEKCLPITRSFDYTKRWQSHRLLNLGKNLSGNAGFFKVIDDIVDGLHTGPHQCIFWVLQSFFYLPMYDVVWTSSIEDWCKAYVLIHSRISCVDLKFTNNSVIINVLYNHIQGGTKWGSNIKQLKVQKKLIQLCWALLGVDLYIYMWLDG